MDRERASELIAQERRRVEALVAELLASSAGAYGRCEVCGEVTPVERPEAVPATRYCVGDRGR